MRILLALFCTLSIAACSCQRDPGLAAELAPLPVTAASGEASPAAIEAAANVAAKAKASRVKRQQAMSDAVDVLHGYLSDLGSGRREQADQRWAYRRTPTDREEAGIRSLPALQSLRIRNETPEPLDDEPVPDSLQIPVTLVATLDSGEALRFIGWYRLRHNPVQTRWEITGVSLSPVLR